MTTYLIAREITITRQEGDLADIVITVPAVITLVGKTVRFQVRDINGRVIMDKKDAGVSIADQVISIPLYPDNTLRRAGKHRWELEVSDSDGPITIGKGPFVIIKTDIV